MESYSVDDLLTYCEQATDELVINWERLVNIDSGSGDREGLKKVGDIIIEKLQECGCRTEIFPNNSQECFNVIGRLQGSGKVNILMFAHMDTVFSPGTALQRPFRIEEDKAYGPGVSDDKGSIVLALAALKIMSELKFSAFNHLTIVFNCDEETGSEGSRALLRQLAQEHDVALCLEPGRPGDGLVNWRKGAAFINLTVKGRAAHAGSAPQNGRNALMEIIHQIRQLSALENPDKMTTVNFSVIKAGERYNVIPDYAYAQADVRTLYPEEFDRIREKLADAANNRLIPDTEIDAKLVVISPPFSKNPRTDWLAAKAQQIYTKIGRTLKVEGAGGTSDANETAAAGVPTIDGLGIVSGGANHTPLEFAQVDSVVPRLYLLVRLIMEIAANENSFE